MTLTPSDRRGALYLWLTIGSLLGVEIIVRFVLPFDSSRVLLVESVSFVVAAALLSSISHRLVSSRRAKTAVTVLALALVLGAMRSALWLADVPVQYANLVILLAALAVFFIWWRQRKAG